MVLTTCRWLQVDSKLTIHVNVGVNCCQSVHCLWPGDDYSGGSLLWHGLGWKIKN